MTMDEANYQTAGNRKIKLRIHLRFFIRSDSEISFLRSTLAALPSCTTVGRTEETSEGQSHQDYLVNWFRQMRLSTPKEAGADPKRDEDAHDISDATWTTKVNERIFQLDGSEWHLAHVRSPFIHLTPQLTSTIASVCDAIRHNESLTIGLSYLPRLRVEIKPETSAFSITEVRRTLLFLWSASQRIDTLHEGDYGPRSPDAPGLEFSRLFNPVDLVYPLSGGKVNILDDVFNVRGSLREKTMIRAIEVSDDMQWLVEGTNAHLWDLNCKERIVQGVYDFSSLLEPHKGFIRFNQHAGTLDPEAIDNWARVCCGIVDFCLNATSESLECVKKRLNLPSNLDPSIRTSPSRLYTVLDLLDDLELPSQAAYYTTLDPNPSAPELVSRRRWTPTVNIDETEGVAPYTFGVELEFLMPYSLVGAHDPDRDDPRWIYRHDPSFPASSKSIFKDEYNDGGRRQAPRSTSWETKFIKAEALGKQVYAANANYLVNLLMSAGHLSATFDTIADDADPSETVIPASALESIINKAGNPPIYFLEGLDPRYQIWHIHRDPSLSSFHRGEPGFAGHVGVEVSSPILRACPADFDKIFDVLKVLRGGVRPMLDSSCGFHVHVGDIRGFSLRSLKKIATLVWVAELVLYGCVHPSRESNIMTVPLGKGSTLACTEDLPEYTTTFDLQNPDTKEARMEAMRLSQEIEMHVPMDITPQRLRDEILQIWSVTSEYGLVRLLQPDQDCKGGVSFLSIRSDIEKQSGAEKPSYRGTVKFRLLEGTLDPELIKQWTKLVLSIVERGTQSEPVEYFHMMKKVLKEYYYNDSRRLAGFLTALGMEDDVPFWSKVAGRNMGLAEKDDEQDVEGGADKEQWQYKVDMGLPLTDVEKDACLRHWYKQTITRVPAVDDDSLERARSIL
ncbi:hypothetical protein LZ32DRAFT_615022 [Colletotrichum eremochloae]|nr:hypothetical protein LZ32DRAFT_615022 [Colletotrichum eremochloae]